MMIIDYLAAIHEELKKLNKNIEKLNKNANNQPHTTKTQKGE